MSQRNRSCHRDTTNGCTGKVREKELEEFWLTKNCDDILRHHNRRKQTISWSETQILTIMKSLGATQIHQSVPAFLNGMPKMNGWNYFWLRYWFINTLTWYLPNLFKLLLFLPYFSAVYRSRWWFLFTYGPCLSWSSSIDFRYSWVVDFLYSHTDQPLTNLLPNRIINWTSSQEVHALSSNKFPGAVLNVKGKAKLREQWFVGN